MLYLLLIQYKDVSLCAESRKIAEINFMHLLSHRQFADIKLIVLYLHLRIILFIKDYNVELSI